MQNSHNRPTVDDDSEADVHTVNYYDTSDIELSVTVVHTVLEATDKEPTEVNLNSVIQPDALNRIFSPKHDGTPRDGGTIEFELAGCHVTIEGDGKIHVEATPQS